MEVTVIDFTICMVAEVVLFLGIMFWPSNKHISKVLHAVSGWCDRVCHRIDQIGFERKEQRRKIYESTLRQGQALKSR